MYLLVLHDTKTSQKVWDDLLEIQDLTAKFKVLHYIDWVLLEFDDITAIEIRLTLPDLEIYDTKQLPTLVQNLFMSATHINNHGPSSQV